MSDRDKTYPDEEVTAQITACGLQGWYFEGGWLQRKYLTDGWPTTLMLVNAIGFLCEAAWHHADLAVTWGKVDKETYVQSTESLQADYSTVVPFLVKALLENRARYAARAAEIGLEALAAEDPRARGYLRPREGYRLYARREELVARLRADVAANREWLLGTLRY